MTSNFPPESEDLRIYCGKTLSLETLPTVKKPLMMRATAPNPG